MTQSEQTFTKLYDHVMLSTVEGVNLNDKIVYCYLYRWEEQRRDGKVKDIFVSNKDIMAHTGLGLSTVKGVTAKLQKLGLIKKTQRLDTSNLWQVFEWSMTETTPATTETTPSHNLATKRLSEEINEQINLTSKEKEVVAITDTTVVKEVEVVEVMTSPSTVYDVPTVSNQTSIPTFTSSSDAFAFVQSMGDTVTWQSFSREFGSSCRYTNVDLGIDIRRVI